jgi:hypothetical protein
MKVIRLSAVRTGHLYPQEIFLLLISVRGSVDTRTTVRPEGLCQWEMPMIPLGIKSMTFRLCSATPYLTAPARVTINSARTINKNIKHQKFFSDPRRKRTILNYDSDFCSLTSVLNKTPPRPRGAIGPRGSGDSTRATAHVISYCGFFRTGLRSSDTRQYSGPLSWALGVILLIIIGGWAAVIWLRGVPALYFFVSLKIWRYFQLCNLQSNF